MGEKQKSRGGDGSAAAEEGRLRTILNAMVEAVFVTDARGRVTMTNPALDDLIAEDIRGMRAKNVMKSKELKRAIRRARKKDEAADVEIEEHIGDRVRTFHAQVSPLPKGRGVVTVLHDVTRLKEADRIRRDFVANASHELRTPLTAVRGFAETLANGACEDPKAALRFSEAILRHTKRLQRLAEDLTLLAQAESPDEDYADAPTDITKVAADCVAMLDSFAREKGVKLGLELPEGPVVSVTSGRALEHVLLNLIENGIKYGREDGTVVVEVRADTDRVLIEVRDDGAGIPEKYQERIFERFYRVDKGRSRSEGGTGLGLSIARHLVNKLDGSLELESEEGEGSTFTVELPWVPEDAL